MTLRGRPSPRWGFALVLLLTASVAAQQRFAAAVAGPTLDPLETPLVFADLDGDGDEDLWSGRRLFLRQDQPDGTRFLDVTASGLPSGLEVPNAVAFGDVDGDGDADAVLGFDAVDVLLLNDGQAGFSVAPTPLPARSERTNDVELFDADGDGDLDCMAVTGAVITGGQDRFYRNDGTGVFVDDTLASLPQGVDVSESVASGDLDGDGDRDLVVLTRVGLSSPSNDRILWNDGAGHFATRTGSGWPISGADGWGVALVDVDADADLDIVTMDTNILATSVRVAINDGAGVFVAGAPSPPQTVFQFVDSFVVGDLDGDQDEDILAGRVWVNDGSGVFTAGSKNLGVGALTDVDSDGDLDLATNLGFFANDGGAGFTERSLPSRAVPNVSFVETADQNADGVQDFRWRAAGLAERRPYLPFIPADLDGDGVLEMVGFTLVRSGVPTPAPITIWQDDGTGAYLSRDSGVLTPALGLVTPLVSRTAIPAVGDLDGDGDDDFVLATLDRTSLLSGQTPPCQNAHELMVYFSDAGMLRPVVITPASFTLSVGTMDLADADGDGDLDLALGVGHADCPGVDRLLINDGTGRFSDESAQRLPAVSEWTTRILFADVDGDGDEDLVRTSEVLLFATRSTFDASLWLNDGSGRFTDAGPGRVPASIGVNIAGAFNRDDIVPLQAADLDGDGHIDLATEVLAINDGSGTFTDETSMLTGAATLSGNVVADLDLDGDADLFADGMPAFINQQRQWASDGSPQIGGAYTLTATAMRGPASGRQVVVALIGFQSVELPSPFGTLGVAPIDVVRPLSVPVPGTAAITIQVPSDPGLIGLRVFSQPLFLGPLGAPETRFGNVVVDSVQDLWLR